MDWQQKVLGQLPHTALSTHQKGFCSLTSLLFLPSKEKRPKKLNLQNEKKYCLENSEFVKFYNKG